STRAARAASTCACSGPSPTARPASTGSRACGSTMKGCSAMRRGGFTLIEMMTVVAIFGLVAVYVGRILTVNERAYHTVENTSESQQNLRVFGELVEDDIRHAGMMVSRNSAVCGRDFTNAPDVLYVSDAAAIDPQDDATPYTGVSIT